MKRSRVALRARDEVGVVGDAVDLDRDGRAPVGPERGVELVPVGDPARVDLVDEAVLDRHGGLAGRHQQRVVGRMAAARHHLGELVLRQGGRDREVEAGRRDQGRERRAVGIFPGPWEGRRHEAGPRGAGGARQQAGGREASGEGAEAAACQAGSGHGGHPHGAAWGSSPVASGGKTWQRSGSMATKTGSPGSRASGACARSCAQRSWVPSPSSSSWITCGPSGIETIRRAERRPRPGLGEQAHLLGTAGDEHRGAGHEARGTGQVQHLPRGEPDRHAVGTAGLDAAGQQARLADEAVHEERARAVVDAARRVDLLDAAAVHQDQAVGEALGLLLVVRDQERRDAERPLQPQHLDLQVEAQGAVERAERLVEQQQGGAARERPGHRDPLLLAAGQLMGQAPAEIVELDEAEHLVDPGAAFRLRDPLAGQRIGDVLGHGHVGKSA